MSTSATQVGASISSQAFAAQGAALWTTTRATLNTTTEQTEQMLDDVIAMLARISPVSPAYSTAAAGWLS
jgi:hypothetical protein